MIRTTITMDAELTRELDDYITRSGATNRSEAIRDLVRRGLNALPTAAPDAPCIGVVSYAIDQKAPGLAKRVRMERLHRHDEIVSTVSVPVNHTNTVDIVVLQGTVERVNDYAQQLFLERGVKHGTAALIPVGEEPSPDAGEHAHDHDHVHIRIQESF